MKFIFQNDNEHLRGSPSFKNNSTYFQGADAHLTACCAAAAINGADSVELRAATTMRFRTSAMRLSSPTPAAAASRQTVS